MLWPLLDVVNRRVLSKEHFFSSWHRPLILLAGIGFIVGVIGHLFQTKTAIVIGIAMIFTAVLLFPIFLYARGHP
jgi:hypothetical protein